MAIPVRRMAEVRKSSCAGNIRLPSASHSVCATLLVLPAGDAAIKHQPPYFQKKSIMKHSIQQLLSKSIQTAGMKHIFSLCSFAAAAMLAASFSVRAADPVPPTPPGQKERPLLPGSQSFLEERKANSDAPISLKKEMVKPAMPTNLSLLHLSPVAQDTQRFEAANEHTRNQNHEAILDVVYVSVVFFGKLVLGLLALGASVSLGLLALGVVVLVGHSLWQWTFDDWGDQPVKFAAVTSLVLGLGSIVAFSVILSPIALGCGAFAAGRGNRAGWSGLGLGIVGLIGFLIIRLLIHR
jgi:hypothetical protein